MPDTPATPNYNETNVTGQSWQRAHHIVIENPYNGVARLTIGEQKVFQLGDKVITEYVGQGLSINFDPTNPKHVDLYLALNEIYTELREARDAALAEPAP